MKNKYMTIGAITGTVVTVERLIRLRDTIDKDDWRDPAFVGGAIIGGVTNVVLWPLAVVGEIYGIIRGV